MKKSIKYSILTAVLLISAKAWGQGNEPQKKNFGENVVVEQAYKPKLTDAVKIDVTPVAEAPDSEKPAMQYATQTQLLPMKPFKTNLKAPSISQTPVSELHHNYVKLGFGNYSNIYAEYFYNSLRSRDKMFTAHALHHSGSGPLKGSRFGESLVDIYGKKLFGKIALDGNLGFSENAYRYYALVPDSVYSTDLNAKQHFTDIHFGANLGNAEVSADKFRFKTGFGFYNFSDKFKTSENDINLVAQAIEPMKDNRIVIEGNFDYIRYNFIKANNRTLFKVNAQYQFQTKGLRINAGFNTANETDSIEPKFHFYPDVKIEADLADKFLTVYGGLTGNLYKNTFKSFAQENPFIISGANIRNTNKKVEFFGGIKGSLTDNMSYRAGVAYQNYNNLYFYLNDSTDPRKFVPVYDTGTTTVLNFNLEMGYTVTESLNLNTSFNYNHYGVSSLPKPYQRPGMEWKLTGRYNAQNKLIFGGDIYMWSGRYARVLGSDKDISLRPIVDLNASLTYVFSNLKGLQAFVEAQNLMATKYQLWNYYPTRAFQITGGVKFSFL